MNSAPTLADLIATAEAGGHDHAGTEKSTGLRHIHNHATGGIVWFPTWRKFRETADWSEAVDSMTGSLKAASAEEWAAKALADDLDGLLERAAGSGNAADFAGNNLTHHLTRTWAIGDAVAKATGKDFFTGGATPPVFAGYPYDVYAQDGGVFATSLWDDIIDARRNRALAEEAARKALKPVSRKALKNAARKAGRR